MTFTPCAIDGVWKIEMEPRGDDRGWFMRTFCEEAFLRHGLNVHWPQANTTRTRVRGAIRGMHWQAEPQPEAKLIRCSRGTAWDVVVDVRPGSPTFGQWVAFELSEEHPTEIYVPVGCAHGFQCLTDDVELNYLMSAPYVPGLARGLRWDDPTVGIRWPLPPTVMSDRDRSLPPLSRPG
jgi:dTDP-4-dehydrorhamnose 3,5-epimerase